ncbi:YidH family protein [Pelagerythrobacter aerophilus]
MAKDPDRSELAVERTKYAEDRNIMAMERTFAGWIRTAFAAIGIGVAFRALFGELEPPWLAKAIATLFILAGAALAFSAQRRACRTLERLHPHSIERPSSPNFRLLAFAVMLGAGILIAGLWLLNDGSLSN